MAATSSPNRNSWMNEYEAVELEVPETELLRSSNAFSPSPLTSPPLSGSSTVSRSATSSSRTVPSRPPSSANSKSPSPPPRFLRQTSSTASLMGPRRPSEDSRVLSSSPGGDSRRASMILYHIPTDGPLTPPPGLNRLTMLSAHSRDSTYSTISYSSDSKYPGALNEHDVQPYVFDPEMDGGLFDKEDLDALGTERRHMSWRGITNFVALIVILAAIFGIFVILPVVSLSHDSGKEGKIVNNKYINGTGQATGYNHDLS